MTYSIPGRPTAPTGGPDSDNPAPIGPLQVSAPTPLTFPQTVWWRFTAPERGRFIFDTLLTDPILGGGSIVLTLYTAELGFLDNTGFNQLVRDVDAGDYLISVHVDYGPAVTAYLRVSDYAPMTAWVTEDPVPVVAGPPPGMSWNVLPDDPSYPLSSGYQPEILPDPVVFNYPITGPVTKYLNPWDSGIGFQGSAEMVHTPDPAEEAPHPYEYPAAWLQIWLAALGGISADSEDNFGSFTPNEPFVTNVLGESGAGTEAPVVPHPIWISTRTWSDWPIGRVTTSSDIDLSPPDGHQTIGDTVRENYWQASISKALGDGFFDGSVKIDETVNGDEPTDVPAEEGSWDLQWEDPEPTLLSVETRNVGRSDGDLDTGYFDAWGTWRWHVTLYPLTWDGDADHLNGAWLMNSTLGDPFDVASGAEGDVFTSNVVDGSVSRFHEVIGGLPPIPGTEVAVVDPYADDWTPVLDSGDVADALAYEAPLNDTLAAYSGMGALWFGGMLNIRHGPPTDPGAPPQLGRGPITEIGQSTLQFPGLRFIFQRPRHRWISDPVIPDVVTNAPSPYRLIQRPSDGLGGGGQQTYRATGTTYGSNRTIGASW